MKRNTIGWYRAKTSRMVKKFPSDFDIFSESTFTKPLWTQYRTNFLSSDLCISQSQAALDWASSFSWCGNTRSWPPPWMSITGPRSFSIIAEHSMCHPGRPWPQGDSQVGSFGFAVFHRAKSAGFFFLLSTTTRSPARLSSWFLPDKDPYFDKELTEKYTSPSTAYAWFFSISRVIKSIMSPTCCVARGSKSGRKHPSASISSWNACINFSVNSSQDVPDSFARLIILSSISVKFLQYVTSYPSCCKVRYKTSKAT